MLSTVVDGDRLSRDEIVDVLYLLVIAGTDTVAATAGCILAYLARHPDVRAELVRDPALWPSAIEEFLRFESPVGHAFRMPQEDFQVSTG